MLSHLAVFFSDQCDGYTGFKSDQSESYQVSLSFTETIASFAISPVSDLTAFTDTAGAPTADDASTIVPNQSNFLSFSATGYTENYWLMLKAID